MGFGGFFRGIKDEINKRAPPVKEEQQRVESSPKSRYNSLAAWIKTRYGNMFRDGMSSAEVQVQLESIMKEQEAKGAFKEHPKIANGFRAYISERKYGDLIRING
jgi:hypothetical protein